MIFHFIRIAIISTVILAFIFLPFIPGNYDSLAVPLSFMAQILGIVGLLLVPIGLLWLINELTTQTKPKGDKTYKKARYRFAIMTLVISLIVAIVVSFGAFTSSGVLLGIGTLFFFTYAIIKIIPGVRKLKNADWGGFNATPVYLICIPVLVVLFRFLFIIPATEFSRNYAISQSERLIQDIEKFHQENGYYPLSLLSVSKDYEPSVMGIKEYHYEPFGTAYNLYFEQFTYILDTKEIVMYNKLDEHAMTSHDQDLLENSGNDLNIRRGDKNRHDLPQRHWKYFWFD